MKNRRKICNKLGKSGLLCAMLLVNAGCVDKYLPDEKGMSIGVAMESLLRT